MLAEMPRVTARRAEPLAERVVTCHLVLPFQVRGILRWLYILQSWGMMCGFLNSGGMAAARQRLRGWKRCLRKDATREGRGPS